MRERDLRRAAQEAVEARLERDKDLLDEAYEQAFPYIPDEVIRRLEESARVRGTGMAGLEDAPFEMDLEYGAPPSFSEASDSPSERQTKEPSRITPIPLRHLLPGPSTG